MAEDDFQMPNEQSYNEVKRGKRCWINFIDWVLCFLHSKDKPKPNMIVEY